MRLSYKKVLILECGIIAIMIIWASFYNKINNSNLTSIIVWSLILTFFQILVGIEKDRTSNKVDTLQVVFIYTLAYFVLKYLIGIILGFTRTPYNLTILSILGNITPVIITIILQEVFRYNVIVKCKNNKLIMFLMIIIFIAFTIILNISHYSFKSSLDIFEVIGILILPSIVNNFLLTFADYKCGYYPTILYRIITECLIFVVPIVPDFNVYIESVCEIVFPTILFLKINTIYAKSSFSPIRRKSLTKIALNFCLACLVLVIVFLVSGAFRYYAMAIGSASMTPNIYKGDAVIVEKLSIKKRLKTGMVIAFREGNTVICHRIYKIENKNDHIVITTKGDYNPAPDNWQLMRYDVIGKVNYKIPLIGWPSVWLSELLKKK